jgi:hypothetical protein
MKRTLQIRRTVAALIVAVGVGLVLFFHPDLQQPAPIEPSVNTQATSDAAKTLNLLLVKGRAPKTGYERTQFGDGWMIVNGCDARNTILYRDLKNPVVDDECKVTSGTLHDPYTATTIEFKRGAETSDDVQIDHVVALSDAWQKGAQQLSFERRQQLANDPLELLAVEGKANMQKSDSDAASWLPPSKAFRCQYVARQIAVKKKYELWVTEAEKQAMLRVLEVCPGQKLPG